MVTVTEAALLPGPPNPPTKRQAKPAPDGRREAAGKAAIAAAATDRLRLDAVGALPRRLNRGIADCERRRHCC